ncbi:MAG: 2-hydroxyacyl-CoA dehydratase [Promethearchaeota archaeon]|nr:MAG: 2-hydroxyacyl-CoA dehydratase [Candidatus Lokiarchaeota archaeon]
MSIYADDVVSFTSVLKIAYNFLTGREYLKKKKIRERKKLISVALGFPDLVFAADSIPVFPIRMESFKVNKTLLALNSATSVLGWDLTSKILEYARKFDVLKVVDHILDDVINSTNKKYNEMYDLADDYALPADLCYGIKALYGMHISKGNDIDANLNFAIRCSEWNKFSESLKTIVPNQVWINIPSRDVRDDKKNLEIMIENIKKAIIELENITGNIVSDNSLNKQFRIGNQVKRFYKTVIFEFSASNFYPCNPATFSEILALLTITFQDYNSNAQRYLENMSQLVKEMRERIRKGIGMDVSNMPRIVLSPIYAGWEPYIHEIIYNLGGRVIYADWDILGFLEEIPVSNHSDPIEEYARFLLQASSKGIGCDSENLTNSYIKAAKKMEIDGFIFNQVFGCHSLSNTYAILQQKIKNELNIPARVISFKKIGENVEQVKNQLSNFMDTFRKY